MPVEKDDVKTADVDSELECVRTPDTSNGSIAKPCLDGGPTLILEC
jgi:hypothetical protein